MSLVRYNTRRVFSCAIELAQATVNYRPEQHATVAAEPGEPITAEQLKAVVRWHHALNTIETASQRLKRVLGAKGPLDPGSCLREGRAPSWQAFHECFQFADHPPALRWGLHKLATAAVDLSGYACVRQPDPALRDRGLRLLAQGLAQCWSGLSASERPPLRQWLAQSHAALGWPPTPDGEPPSYDGPEEIQIEDQYRVIDQANGFVTRWGEFPAEQQRAVVEIQRQRWVAALAKGNPFGELLKFAYRTQEEETGRLAAAVGTRRPDPHEWAPRFQQSETELGTLVEACLCAAERTGFPVTEVEHRINALAEALRSILLWQRDAPTSSPEESPKQVEFHNPASDNLIEHLQTMMNAWRPVQALAARIEAANAARPDGLVGAAPRANPRLWDKQENPDGDAVPSSPSRPAFSPQELDQAVQALDLVFQDDELPAGDVRFEEGKLIERLRQRGTTRALARALIEDLIIRHVFRAGEEFSDVRTFVPLNGYQTTDVLGHNRYLHTSREAWYGFLVAWNADRSTDAGGQVGPTAHEARKFSPLPESVDVTRMRQQLDRLVAANISFLGARLRLVVLPISEQYLRDLLAGNRRTVRVAIPRSLESVTPTAQTTSQSLEDTVVIPEVAVPGCNHCEFWGGARVDRVSGSSHVIFALAWDSPKEDDLAAEFCRLAAEAGMVYQTLPPTLAPIGGATSPRNLWVSALYGWLRGTTWVTTAEGFELITQVVAASAELWRRLLHGTTPDGRVQAGIDPPPIGSTALSGPARPRRKAGKRDRKLEARDKWLYRQCCAGVSYKKIQSALSKRCKRDGWSPIDSVQGIRAAAIKYADRNQLPPPPNRQNL